jgi:hypothetical protein
MHWHARRTSIVLLIRGAGGQLVEVFAERSISPVRDKMTPGLVVLMLVVLMRSGCMRSVCCWSSCSTTCWKSRRRGYNCRIASFVLMLLMLLWWQWYSMCLRGISILIQLGL